MASRKKPVARMPMRRYEKDFSPRSDEEADNSDQETDTPPVRTDITTNPHQHPLRPDAGEENKNVAARLRTSSERRGNRDNTHRSPHF